MGNKLTQPSCNKLTQPSCRLHLLNNLQTTNPTLKDQSYIAPLIDNLVRLLNDGTWLDDKTNTVQQMMPQSLIVTLCNTLQLPAISFVNGSTVQGSKLDPFEFGTALKFSGGSCETKSAQVKWCYPRCPPDYTGVGPVCWQNCPGGYTDTGIRCEDMYGNGVGYTKLQSYGRGAGRSCLHGFFKCDCNSDEDKWGAMCYPKCQPGFSNTGCCICDRWACNPGDFDNGAGMCYPACREGYTTPTGIVCTRSFTKSTATRGVGRMTTGDCNADEDSSTVIPDDVLNTCYGASGWGRLASISGLSTLKITKTELQYDGCDKASRSMILRCTASAVITINVEYGFKLCLGVPIGPNCPWPEYTYQRSFTSPVTLDIVITIPFDTDWLTNIMLNLGQSSVKFENISGLNLDDFITLARECMGIASAAAVTAAGLIVPLAAIAVPLVTSLIAGLWITLEVELKKFDMNILYQLINTEALTKIPSNLIAEYCPIKDFQLLFAGDPCK